MQKLSEAYETNKIYLYAKLLTLEENDPRAEVASAPHTIHRPHDHGKKRIGRPRLNWIVETSNTFWNLWVRPRNNSFGPFDNFNPDNMEHVVKAREAAQSIIKKLEQRRKAQQLQDPAELLYRENKIMGHSGMKPRARHLASAHMAGKCQKLQRGDRTHK